MGEQEKETHKRGMTQILTSTRKKQILEPLHMNMVCADSMSQ